MRHVSRARAHGLRRCLPSSQPWSPGTEEAAHAEVPGRPSRGEQTPGGSVATFSAHIASPQLRSRLPLELLNSLPQIPAHELRVPIAPLSCARHDVLPCHVDLPGEPRAGWADTSASFATCQLACQRPRALLRHPASPLTRGLQRSGSALRACTALLPHRKRLPPRRGPCRCSTVSPGRPSEVRPWSWPHSRYPWPGHTVRLTRGLLPPR